MTNKKMYEIVFIREICIKIDNRSIPYLIDDPVEGVSVDHLGQRVTVARSLQAESILSYNYPHVWIRLFTPLQSTLSALVAASILLDYFSLRESSESTVFFRDSSPLQSLTVLPHYRNLPYFHTT